MSECELQLAGEGRMGDRHLWIAGQHQKAGALHTVHQLLALDAEDLVVQFGLAILNGDSHVHQPLLGDGVGHIDSNIWSMEMSSEKFSDFLLSAKFVRCIKFCFMFLKLGCEY